MIGMLYNVLYNIMYFCAVSQFCIVSLYDNRDSDIKTVITVLWPIFFTIAFARGISKLLKNGLFNKE